MCKNLLFSQRLVDERVVFLLCVFALQPGRLQMSPWDRRQMNGHKKARRATKSPVFVAFCAFLWPFISSPCGASPRLLCIGREFPFRISLVISHSSFGFPTRWPRGEPHALQKVARDLLRARIRPLGRGIDRRPHVSRRLAQAVGPPTGGGIENRVPARAVVDGRGVRSFAARAC